MVGRALGVKLQLLSDLHLETETFDPVPAPGAEVLVLAGDIDSGWGGYERFAGWPVPVVVVAGNHVELRLDCRDLGWPAGCQALAPDGQAVPLPVTVPAGGHRLLLRGDSPLRR